MKKLILCVCLILSIGLILTALTASSVHVRGVEDVEVIQEEQPAEPEQTDTKVAELISKVNTYLGDANGYFANTILPLIIGAGSALLTSLGALIPFLKTKAKYKAALASINNLEKQTEELQTLLTSTDITKIKEALQSLFSGELAKAVNNLKLDGAVYAEQKALLEIILAKLDAIINGAINAWSKSDGAVAALTAAPEHNVLNALEKENIQLKQYIREIKGAEAEEEIKKITM